MTRSPARLSHARSEGTRPTGFGLAPVEARAGLRGRDLLSIHNLTRGELLALLELSADIKQKPSRYAGRLSGKTLALIFEKPSLRTRVSFDVAAHQLGAHSIYLAQREIGLGQRESIGDIARTLDGMVDALAARTCAHGTVEELARAMTVPVINALSDRDHPCQALADFFTMQEVKGNLEGLRLAYVGDGNNVATSLIEGAALLGVRISVASPPGYEPPADVLDWARRHAASPDMCQVTASPEAAVQGANAVYTDTWISMGQEGDATERRRAFSGFQVTGRLLELAAPEVVFMHCLPAHRGEEVAADVIDSPRSVVFRQAENRLHTEKALLMALLASGDDA